MADYTELEIKISHGDSTSYLIELRYNDPDEQEIRPPEGCEAWLDAADLSAHRLDIEGYGQILSQFIFGDPKTRLYFNQALQAAGSKQVRLRLFVDRSAPELHNVRWETLRHPENDRFLAKNENILFSRLLASLNWEQLQLRPKGQLRSLVAVANPLDLETGKYEVDGQALAPVDTAGEIERARAGLAQTLVATLASTPEAPGQVTLNNLVDQLREGCDILYLVCHGALSSRENVGTYLLLENSDGTADLCSGRDFVERLANLPAELRPRLVVLISCQSAGQGEMRASDTQGALAAVGPRLAQAGIPAVLAMQGNVSMTTIEQFVPAFFSRLFEDGQLDQALAAARGVIGDRSDWWMPVLFMRLRAGALWYQPGFSEDTDETERWESLKSTIWEQRCTVIVGPGLNESFLGSQAEIARRWAEKHGYPLSETDIDEMPRIAQYVSINKDTNFLRTAYREAIQFEILRRYPELVDEQMKTDRVWSTKSLEKVLHELTRQVWNPEKPEAYQLLARLRLPIYITANTTDFLSEALREAGLNPQVRLCPWNNLIPEEKFLYEGEEPTPEEPLVYHLFGHISEEDSLVLSEDEFFDYLIGVTLNRKWIPSVVRAAMTNAALLFLGFRMDDWQLRVFFRMIMAQEGKERLEKFKSSHAAAQIVPGEGHIRDMQRARQYLEKFFNQEKISVYWGSSEEFLAELVRDLEGEQ
ncbi:MAG: CHAT domain-containing protein [Anaerolineales bacterium]